MLGEILHKERQAGAFPRNQADVQSFLADAMNEDLKSASRFGSFDPADGGFDDQGFDDEDWDDDPDEDDESEQAGLFNPYAGTELSAKQRASLQESLEKNGIDSPEQLMQNPKLMVEAMAKALGQNLSKAELKFLTEEMGKMIAAAGTMPGGNSKKDRKGKR